MTNLPSPDECRARAARLRARALANTKEQHTKEDLEEANLWEAIGAEMERRQAKGTIGTKAARHRLVTPQESGRIGGRLNRTRTSEVQVWLDSIGRNSKWLAEQLGCSPATVRAEILGRQGKRRPVVKVPRTHIETVERLSGGLVRREHWPHPEV